MNVHHLIAERLKLVKILKKLQKIGMVVMQSLDL